MTTGAPAGELAGGVEALEIDGDGFGPEFKHGNATADLQRGAAVAVPDEDDGCRLFLGGGGSVDEAGACDAVDGEFERLKSFGQLNLGEAGGGGQQSEEKQATAVHDGMR